MTITQLMELRLSTEAPFNHEHYTIWLHNKIVSRIRGEIEAHENGNYEGHIQNLPSLKLIKLNPEK